MNCMLMNSPCLSPIVSPCPSLSRSISLWYVFPTFLFPPSPHTRCRSESLLTTGIIVRSSHAVQTNNQPYKRMQTYVNTDLYANIHKLLFTYTAVHIHTYARTYIHAYRHAYIHTYINTCIHTYIHIYIHMHVHVCRGILVGTEKLESRNSSVCAQLVRSRSPPHPEPYGKRLRICGFRVARVSGEGTRATLLIHLQLLYRAGQGSVLLRFSRCHT